MAVLGRGKEKEEMTEYNPKKKKDNWFSPYIKLKMKLNNFIKVTHYFMGKYANNAYVFQSFALLFYYYYYY